MSMITRILTWLYECRNRISIGFIGLSCLISTFIILRIYLYGSYGLWYVIGLGVIILPLFYLGIIIFIVEQVFKRLRLPKLLCETKLFKVSHIINLINIIVGIIPVSFFGLSLFSTLIQN